MDYLELHKQYKANALYGWYITLQDIEPLLSKYQSSVIGQSVLGKPIYQLVLGTGGKRIFMWSQMHGNESTTTKALFDFINFLQSDTEPSRNLLRAFTFCFLPMVNPDGAEFYTRENAGNIDLNRDSQHLTQPESQALRQVFESFKPDFCYNLHDQRTIFGVADSGLPATVSFLSPAFNENRDMNDVRSKAISVIAAMNEDLQQLIPGQVGRFDDAFNINCIGDQFQSLNVPTILFEAGHFPNDYEREETRKYIFVALLSGIRYLYENDVVDNKNEDYLKIPQNKVVFFDIVYKNVNINYDGNEKIINFAAQYKEVLSQGRIMLEARIAQIGDLENYFGHTVIDGDGRLFDDGEVNFPNIGQKADFCLGKDVKIVNGLIKN